MCACAKVRKDIHYSRSFVCFHLTHAQGSHTLVVASDGVWDVASADVVAAAIKRGEKGESTQQRLEGGSYLSAAL